MNTALQEYYREVEEKAEKFAKATEMRERAEHLRAFNLGRIAQRAERVKLESWVRLSWLFAGLAIGVVVGGGYRGSWYSAGAKRFFAKSEQIARDAGKSAAQWMLR